MISYFKKVFQDGRNTKRFFFLLTLLVGLFSLWPYNDFQFMLSTGDHGRDLYCFKKSLDGALPYRDYSWLFGPLMPYYYGLFFRACGVSIQSVLLGQNILILAVGMMLYLTGILFIPPTLAFVCAAWYWAYRGVEFFYTYNHSGALLCLVTALYWLLRYIRRPQKQCVFWGSLALLGLLLIRINIGVSTLAAFFSSLLVIDWAKKEPSRKQMRRTYAGLIVLLLAVTVLVYGCLLYALPSYVLGQTFPFQKTYRTDITPGPAESLKAFWLTLVVNSTHDAGRIILFIILTLSLVQTILSFRKGAIDKTERVNLNLVFGAILLLILVTLHEFIASGVHYRLFWILPLFMVLMFVIISTGTRTIPTPAVRFLIFITLVMLPLTSLYRNANLLRILKQDPLILLQIGPNKVYLQSPVDVIQTITNVSRFIKEHTREDEKIFALPFDPLYYFLSERDGASRQLMFFDHRKITAEQEQDAIADLEKNHVRYILISNRAISPQEQLGVLGETYCRLLYGYIQGHYRPVALYGPWQAPAGWGWNHSVKIYERFGND
ncbi:MAG: hypothetical protein WC450_13035 [Candidatus Omnitrophota bacterium]|jgi:hypothetical protein